MSSHHTHDRAAIILKGVIGDYIVLFDKGHSNNVDPYIAKWSLYSFSHKEKALELPFQYAYYCEDGASRGKNGQPITGEYHINQWRKAVTSAMVVPEGTFIELKFFDQNSYFEMPMWKFDGLTELAANLKIALRTKKETLPGKVGNREVATVWIDFSVPEHVDLIHATTRDNSTGHEAGATVNPDSYKRLMMPFEIFSRSMATQLFWHRDFDTKNVEVKTVRSSWEFKENLIGLTFSNDDAYGYQEDVTVVRDWTGKVLSTSPMQWFGLQLTDIEQRQPGSAESAYRKFKAELKAVKNYPMEGMTVEVSVIATTGQLRELGEWRAEQRQELFNRCHKPGFPALFTDRAKDHKEALRLAPVIDCNLYVPAVDDGKHTGSTHGSQEQLSFA